MRAAIVIALLVGAQAASAQVGAPIIEGLGGPFDVGAPHAGVDLVPLAPALPDGVRFHAAVADHELRVNWRGSLSFIRPDTRFGTPIPGPFNGLGMGTRRLVPFQHTSELTQYEIGEIDPLPPTYIGQVPPGDDGSPGRFVATWFQVTDRPPEPGTLRNTWQVILTGPDPADFEVEFRYHQCQWARGRLREEGSAMGFDGGEGPDGPGWMWPGSLSDDMLLLCRLSNVRERGVFRYRIIDGIPTGCGIDPEPPPGEGRCADGNHLPGDGCSPACYVEPDIDGDGRFEAPHPDSVDPRGVYDDCTDVLDPLCNDDPDGDGTPSIADNCPDDANPDQRDYDRDGMGDVCDLDADGDDLAFPHIPDNPLSVLDLCPFRRSRGDRRLDESRLTYAWQYDLDRDELGDPCDSDDDGDGILDCGGDGLCDPGDDGYDNDRDLRIDEAGECADGTCPAGNTDNFDNDADGFTDESTEFEMASEPWPGPDPPPAQPEDNCRRVYNPSQGDIDGDDIGDACDPDMDGDGVANCAGDGICGPLADARDNDFDDRIDEADECAMGCDPARDRVDQDLDGYVDEDFEVEQAARDAAALPPPLDNCPRVPNPDQADWDRDGAGDACDDSDGDGVVDALDNCREAPDREQFDLDGDGIGDVCDDDRDGDGVPNDRESCPDVADDQRDSDGDAIADACDPDDDEDGVNDPFDSCPLDYDPTLADLDGDGRGDVCDPDDDGDGIDDAADICPRVADDQTDTDRDGAGDACDPDDDDDGISDEMDGCPLTADADQTDLDGDGMGDACDPRDDRPFEALGPEEKCALLTRERAPTAERLLHCPPSGDGGCKAAPGGSDRPCSWVWLLLIGGALSRAGSHRPARRRKRHPPSISRTSHAGALGAPDATQPSSGSPQVRR